MIPGPACGHPFLCSSEFDDSRESHLLKRQSEQFPRYSRDIKTVREALVAIIAIYGMKFDRIVVLAVTRSEYHKRLASGRTQPSKMVKRITAMYENSS